MRVPRRRKRRARALPRQREAFGRPLLVTLVEQRQVQQPFAGIIDDIDGELALRAISSLVRDGEAQLADVGGRGRPLSFVDQCMNMALVVETRHGVVGLRFELGARDASARQRLEYRKATAAQQAVDQRGDEHRFAGARQAGDAEPDRRIEQMAAVLQQRLCRQTGLFDEVGKTGSHKSESLDIGSLDIKALRGSNDPIGGGGVTS